MQEEFEVGGSRIGGSWGDPEWGLFEDIEDLLGLHSSNTMLVNKFLHVVQAKAPRWMAIEKELQELAEKRVERLLLGSEREEKGPTTGQEVSDLRTESDVVFDQLVAGS